MISEVNLIETETKRKFNSKNREIIDIAIQTDPIKCRELLSSWESLLHWSENEAVAKQLQDEMTTLVGKINKICTSNQILDTESAIHLAIEETQSEKATLYTLRSTMLRLNASVHSWLTRQELKNAQRRKQIETVTTTIIEQTEQIQTVRDENGNAIDEVTLQMEPKTTTEIDVKEITTQGTDTNEFFVDDEFHKQLKNEVANMYSVWELADERVKNRLEFLTASLIAWKQFESGLNEFKEALGKDKGTLEGLTDALEMESDAISNDLAQNVKEVAKRLSEKIDNHVIVQQTSVQSGSVKLSQFGAIAFNLPSNGSLSDSGISDGGGSSDYGLSERERRLGALRRLVKQLEQALVPGSAALNSINQRMEMAESELRSLQDTCRQLIVRTAASQPTQMTTGNGRNDGQRNGIDEDNDDANTTMIQQQQQTNFPSPISNGKSKQLKRNAQSKRKTRRRTNSNSTLAISMQQQQKLDEIDSLSRPSKPIESTSTAVASSEPDPDDPKGTTTLDDGQEKRSWTWRVARYALPMQIAIVALFCAACLMEPHCCDGINNYAWSLTPQLRYVRGPPPI